MDWNIYAIIGILLQKGLHPRGGVDWNKEITKTISQEDKVSTLVVEWIEIKPCQQGFNHQSVSTLVVEWIEMIIGWVLYVASIVSTLVVEWIEICWWKTYFLKQACVSTLVVEWIEISQKTTNIARMKVSTLVVEWIEISNMG